MQKLINTDFKNFHILEFNISLTIKSLIVY